MAAPAKEPRRYGLGWVLVTIALATAVFAALGVLAAHLGH
jgi:Na+/pantothenate symporter